MTNLAAAIDDIASQHGFSGAVRVDRAGAAEVDAAYGFASRAYGVPNTPGTRFALASATKGFTACAVVNLIDDGLLSLETTARSLLGNDLPLIADDVTVEHLLTHRSGIGDYLDEDAGGLDDFPPPPPGLVETSDYLPALDGHPTKFAAGERFSYCNGGYVVLALLAERAAGVAFTDIVQTRVCDPASMADTAFLRSDELPANTATGYVQAEGLRTNVFSVPLRGSGDGGIYSTLDDLTAFWRAFFGGRIVSAEWVHAMVRPRSDVPSEGLRYGMGVWLHATKDRGVLDGYDHGVSCRTTHDPAADTTVTVLSNTSEGAWPLVRFLAAELG